MDLEEDLYTLYIQQPHDESLHNTFQNFPKNENKNENKTFINMSPKKGGFVSYIVYVGRKIF